MEQSDAVWCPSSLRGAINNNAVDLTAKSFCAGVGGMFRSSCYRTIGFMVGLQHPDAAGKQQACRQFATTAGDYAQCLSQAGT